MMLKSETVGRLLFDPSLLDKSLLSDAPPTRAAASSPSRQPTANDDVDAAETGRLLAHAPSGVDTAPLQAGRRDRVGSGSSALSNSARSTATTEMEMLTDVGRDRSVNRRPQTAAPGKSIPEGTGDTGGDDVSGYGDDDDDGSAAGDGTGRSSTLARVWVLLLGILWVNLMNTAGAGLAGAMPSKHNDKKVCGGMRIACSEARRASVWACESE